MNIANAIRSILPSADKYFEGTDLLNDGGFETWTSATDLTLWTEDISGGSTINRESTIKYAGTYSMRASVVGNVHAGVFQGSVRANPFKRVRISFVYRTPSGGQARVWCYAGPSFDYSLSGYPGVSPYWESGSGHYVALPESPGAFSRYTIEVDLLAYDEYLFSLSGETTGDFYFDDFSVKELTPAGLVSLWLPSGGNRSIDIIRGNHGQALGGVTPQVLTDIGWTFDGSTGYIDHATVPPQGAISFGFWMQRTVSKASQAIFGMNTATEYPTLLVDGSTSYEYNVVLWLGAANWQYWSPSTPTDASKIGKWYFYVVTLPGASQNDILDAVCYINGVAQNKSVYSASGAQGTRNELWIGRSTAVYNACPVAMPFVANRVLTQAEVANIYLATKGMFFPRG